MPKILNSDKIKEEDQLIQGENYFLPTFIEQTIDTAATNSDSIVNDSITTDNLLQLADSIIDTQLQGALFYLISGHGGPDPGAVSEINGKQISEDEYAYDITLRIARKIETHSGKLFMIINDPDDGIREDELLDIDYDEYCLPQDEIPRNQTQRLVQRADAVNNLYEDNRDYKYQRVIVIHLDSRSTGANVDVFFYHFPGSKKGETTAKTLQSTFSAKYAEFQPNRGYHGTVSARNLLVIRKVLPPAVFIELGNIQNEQDRKRFIKPDNREALAKWIVEGLIEDFENE
ncbi:MAG: N-acetylmuramoyl-L-alanine amidase [Bacteroidales bacterium]|nr:N-acetylmuramoyl-L-alanine amidase [Bacteroidales bacterium]